MIVAQVLFSVKPDRVDGFVHLTMDTVSHSRREARIDLVAARAVVSPAGRCEA